MRNGRLLALVVAAGLLACACEARTEEERLREQVDVVETHLYVALKLAVAGSEDDPRLQGAREAIFRTAAALEREQDGALTKGDVLAAADTVASLWTLRELGAAEVAKWRDSRLAVTRLWLAPSPAAKSAADERAAEDSSLAFDHAVLLLGLTAMRLHPRAPAPVPNTALLYEAYLLGDQTLDSTELDGVAHSSRAITFARNGYCELATATTAYLAARPAALTGKELQDVLGALVGLGRVAAHAPPAAGLVAALIVAQNLPWAARLLAFAATAKCLTDADAPDAEVQATLQYEHALDTAEQAGFAAVELGFLRAYLAHRRGDREGVRRQLQGARESRYLTAQEKKDLDELVAHFDSATPKQLEQFVDSVFISAWLTRLVHHRLESSGFYEQLRRIPVVQVVSQVFADVELPQMHLSNAGQTRGWLGDIWQRILELTGG